MVNEPKPNDKLGRPALLLTHGDILLDANDNF